MRHFLPRAPFPLRACAPFRSIPVGHPGTEFDAESPGSLNGGPFRPSPPPRPVLLALLPLGTAILLGLCFTAPHAAFLAWVALVPLALALRGPLGGWTLYSAVWLTGCVVHLAGTTWLLDFHRLPPLPPWAVPAARVGWLLGGAG